MSAGGSLNPPRLVTPSALSRPADGPVVLVTTVAAATGAGAAAAALACAASGPDRAALLIDLFGARPLRPTPIATAAARELEERLAAHMPETPVASRGRFCHLTLPSDDRGVEEILSALPLARESAAIVHLPPSLWTQAQVDPRIPATAALLRANLTRDRALTALAVRDLLDRCLRVAVLKRPPSWLAARAALLGVLPVTSSVLPAGIRKRVLSTDDKRFRYCYDRGNGAEGEQRQDSRPRGAS